MKKPMLIFVLLAACFMWAIPANPAIAQTGQEATVAQADAEQPKVDAPAEAALLFRNQELLEMTLTANFKALHKSKTKRSGYHPAVITYNDGTGKREMDLRVRSRGHWRLKNCDMPPILLNFSKPRTHGTPFENLDRGRLVMHCKNNDEFDQYVLREYNLYRVWNQLTALSHRARLAKVTYVDSASGSPITTRYAFILEDDDAMAERNGGKVLEAQGAKSGDLNSYHDALVGVFQYMVGNVDWSVAGLHNVILVNKESAVFATVYDFDFTGTVKTRYSIPDYRLPIRTVRQRLFRGYCAPPEEFEQVFAWFNDRKDAIYALYTDETGQLLDPKYREETIKYYDDFYKTINDRGLARDRIVRSCLTSQ